MSYSPRYLFFLGLYTFGLLVFLIGLLQPDPPDVREYKGDRGPQIAIVNRLVMIAVDGLRDDMLLSSKFDKYWPTLRSHMKNCSALCSRSLSQPPSVTLPEVKAITSGGASSFVDLLSNLNVARMKDETWLHRLSSLNWKMEFYGDDTWLKLFPDSFTNSYGIDSFFVNDFFEMDAKVSSYIEELMRQPTRWNGFILHYMGLDHIGHVEGPQGHSLPVKLRELDRAVGQILNSLIGTQETDWLLVLVGTHGMRNRGGHGGDSPEELSAGLMILGPKKSSLQGEDLPNTCDLEYSKMEKTNQVDLATFIGLATGAGIPASSVGILPQQWLETFWQNATTQLLAISSVMKHFIYMFKCPTQPVKPLPNLVNIPPDCSSRLLESNDILLFNRLMNHITLGLSYGTLNMSISLLDRNHTDSSALSLREYVNETQHLLQKIQLQALAGSSQVDNEKMMFGSLLMWVVVVYLCYVILTQFRAHLTPTGAGFSEVSASKTSTPSDLLSLTFVKILSAFGALCLVLQSLSLTGNSFAEEEHRLWYYFSSSLLILFGTLIILSDSWAPFKRSGLLYVAGVLLLDRVFLQHVCSVGLGPIVIPNLSDWFDRVDHPSLIWLAEAFGWFILVLLRWIAVIRYTRSSHFKNVKRLLRWAPALSVFLIALCQLYYRFTKLAEENELAVFIARVVYVLLLLDLIINHQWRRVATSTASLELEPRPINTSWSCVIHPFSTFPLLICLIGRPLVSLLWLGTVVKELLLANVVGLLFCNPKQLKSRSTPLYLGCCWLFYWIQGWTSFFQQGNSLSIATVDLSAAYVGMTSHHAGFAALLLIFHTYAGPLYWQLAYFSRFSKNPMANGSAKTISSDTACFRYGFAVFPITFCAFACLLLQSHPLLWTVFTPKLFYLSVFYFTLVPLFVYWGF
ncbi:unnamed protein product [Calicophoron daubneyi]|uniref:GPI ethanolamine phosphate transferase 2 C-terminal domain-containing protein n=1 Tax=Calicophoron daubneyi TaxID=300641 RepID=A0AAV2TVY3_CALDB